jgi:hypothetical protein
MTHNLCELEETTQVCDRQTRVHITFSDKCVQQTICLHVCTRVCVCVYVSVFFLFVGGFHSPSSQFKKLFPAQFASSCTSLYVILSNFQNCYKIL